MVGRPEELAGFDVLSEIGRGSGTFVYRVRRRGGEYAMKVVQRRASSGLTERMFRREASLLACVDHPGVARVHEVGTVQGRPYLIMDLIGGERLTNVLAAGPLPVDQLLRIGVDIAQALGAAHGARIVHRDVKPDNILIGPDGRARVVDFGLAVGAGDRDAGVAGTLLYSAPEQSGTINRPVDSRADLYALGAVLFECATGRPPFLAPDVGSLLRMHASAAVPDPRSLRADLPPMFSAIAGRLLAKDPDDRYQSAAGLAADLTRLADDPTGADFPVGTADEPVGSVRDHALVGRGEELRALLTRWRQARAGHGGVAVIQGDAGAGKSRLAREFTALVTGRDGEDGAPQRGRGLVLAGKCERNESVPLAALRGAIDRYVARVRALPPDARAAIVDEINTAAGSARSLLRALSPDLGDLVGAPDVAGAAGRRQFAGAAAGFLASLARSMGGAALWLDDVQWLDEATSQVLRQLRTELPDLPLLILVTHRPADVQSLSWLDEPAGLTIRLAPLSPGETADLIADVTGGLRIGGEAAAELAVQTGGNPFTVLEYANAAMVAGLVRPSWGRWLVDTDRLREVPLPTDAAVLVLNRLDDLDPDSRYLLGVGAVVGPRFDPGLVAQACDVPTEHLVAVADAAAWNHVVERVGGSYVFVHDHIRDALLAEFDGPARRDVHERVATALDMRGGTDRDAVYALAFHAERGDTTGRPDRVFRACAAAGRLALADQIPAEAVAYLSRAERAATEAGIDPDADFHVALGLAQHRTGQFRDAIDTLRRAQTRSHDPMHRARILSAISWVHDSTWATDRQAAVIDEALAELGRSLPSNGALLVLSSLGYLAATQAVSLTRVGHGTFRPTRLGRLLAGLYEAGALASTRELRPARAAALAVRQGYVVRRLGRGPEEARMTAANAFLVDTIGLRRLAQRLAARAQATAARVNDQQALAYVAWLDAYRRQTFGEDQGERIRQVLSPQGPWLDIGNAVDLVHTLCWDSLMRGDRAALAEVFQRREALVSSSDQSSRVARHASTAALLALRGRGEEAVAWLDGMRLAAQPHPLRWEVVDIFYGAAIVALETHDVGPDFDAMVAAFEAYGFQPHTVIQAELGLFVYVAYCRLEQCRDAEVAQRPARLAQAKRAVKLARRAARSVVHRAHARVLEAALLQVAGHPDGALRALDAAEPVLRRADAPLVAFETARVRAHALRTLHVDGESERQVDHALAIAIAHEWPARTSRLAVEFGRRVDHSPARIAVGAADPVAAGDAGSSDRIALSRYRQRLNAIEQVGQAASRVLDPTRLIAIALDEIIRILGAERAFLFLVDGEPPRLVPHGGRDSNGHTLGELTHYSATVVERVRTTGTPLVITGTEEGAALGADSVVAHGLRSILVAPLAVEQRLLGVVYLDSRVAKGIFTDDDVGVLVAITNHIAVALETARAAELQVAVTAANEQRDVAEALRDALVDVSATLKPDEVLRRLRATLVDLTGSDDGALVLRGPGARRVSLIAAANESTVDLDEQLNRLLLTGAVRVGSEPLQSPTLAAFLPAARAWLAVPLTTRDEDLGIALLASRATDAYGDARTQVAVALAGQGMIAYDNARLFAQVQRLATVDPLTGLANRRRFFDQADQTLLLARQDRRPLAAMMVDIDGFKQINDEYGHHVGDEVIQVVASRLHRRGHGEDLVGRYGGEEFALLQAARVEEASAAAERLRLSIAETPIDTAAGPLRVTVSIGITDLHPGDRDVNTLLARADDLMYAAKRAGRNRVVVG